MNILITGVSRGLGLEIVKTLLQSGHCIFGISRTTTEEIKMLMEEYPEKIEVFNYDLENTENIRDSIFKGFISKRRIDAYINNAALAYDDIITNINLVSLERMFRINVFSPFTITKYVIRNMLLHNNVGSIVHISSISAHTGYKGLSMYASSKGALEAFSKNTAREWGQYGIRSNCIVAGFMETEMSESLSADQKNRIYQRTAQKKPVDLSSIAKTIEHLIGLGGCSITGQNIFIDSGTI